MHSRSVDLGAATESILDHVYGEAPSLPPPPTVTTLDPGRLASLATAVEAVLRGGPFTQVNAVPEGISCNLEITAAGARLMNVARSPYGPPVTDAVTTLIHAL